MNSTIETAITTSVEVEVDWFKLGLTFANQLSDEQARFLLGWWSNSVDIQVQFIGNSNQLGRNRDSTRAEVAQFFRYVAACIDQGGAK